MTYLAGFAPWIAFWVLAARNGDERRTLLVACLVALAISLVSLLVQRRKVGVSSLDIGSIAFFAGFAVATQFADDTWLATYNQFVSNTALFLIVGVGLLLGHPFTQTYARAAVPETMWDEPHFVRSGVQAGRVWTLTFGVMAASSALLLVVPVDDTSELVLNWIVPFGAFGLALVWQTRSIAAGMQRGRVAAEAALARPVAPGAAVVRGVDHVTTVVDPATAARLAEVLSHRLHLVEAWKYGDFGGFASGGWRIGNVNLEVIGVDRTTGDGRYLPERFVTLEPTSTNGLVAELARRGLACSGPWPQDDGHGGVLYERFELPDLADRPIAQLCAYHLLRPTGPGDSRANPAGLRHVRAVHVASRDVATARSRWAALLAPVGPDASGTYRPGSGPALVVEQGADDDVSRIDVEVEDVPAARAALLGAGLADASTDAVPAVRLGTLELALVTAGSTTTSEPADAGATGITSSTGTAPA